MSKTNKKKQNKKAQRSKKALAAPKHKNPYWKKLCDRLGDLKGMEQYLVDLRDQKGMEEYVDYLWSQIYDLDEKMGEYYDKVVSGEYDKSEKELRALEHVVHREVDDDGNSFELVSVDADGAEFYKDSMTLEECFDEMDELKKEMYGGN